MKLIFLAIAILVGIVLGYVAPLVELKDQLVLYDYLKNLSSLAFAILGAWIAILIPSSVFKVDSDKKTVQTMTDIIHDLRPLVIPMNISICVLILNTIGIFIAIVVAKQSSLFLYYKIGRIVSLEFIYLLTTAQLWAIIYAVFPVNKFMNFAKQMKDWREKVKAEKTR